MSNLQKAFTLALYALAAASWLSSQRKQKRQDPQARESHPTETPRDSSQEHLWSQHPRVRVTHEPEKDGTRVVRFRGPLNDVLDTLYGRQPEEPPALPKDLDWRALPKYYGGCPHCRKRSLYGESLWMYHVVERTREPGDNTTTYVARCRGCRGLMRARIDHDE